MKHIGLRHVEKTQEISSLEYFTFVRLDCEKLRRSLGDVSRKLSNTLLKNVVDTYRQTQTLLLIFRHICEIDRISKGLKE